MLFNSYSFILVFLPLTLAGFFLVSRVSHAAAAAWLTLASLAFYGWWNVGYVALLVGSICANFWFGALIARAVGAGREVRARRWLFAAVTANLAALGYFKYAGFLMANLDALVGQSWSLGHIVLPLGISFFTFTQIAFLVDTYRGYVQEYRFVHYALFVTYFPHLIAGPVLHHKEMMPQFALPATYRMRPENFAVGLSIFAMGLAKKAILADGIAVYANHGFELGATAAHPGLFYSWLTALCYTLQLYFDFSGYSDMAIGLSRLFGVTLPLNFFSPYKAVNISEFWRRWHMTLSRFLRDYLYIPLGGNRSGRASRYRNLMATMLLGGLWHGAGWTFVAWGGLHGLYLTLNHAWLGLKPNLALERFVSPKLRRASARLLTLVGVVVGWVFFRAASFAQATDMLSDMAGLHGAVLPAAFEQPLGSIALPLRAIGVAFTGAAGTQFALGVGWLAVLLPISLFAPNVAQIFAPHRPTLDQSQFQEAPAGARRAMSWAPSPRWAVAVAAIGAAALLSLFHISEFLYYQF